MQMRTVRRWGVALAWGSGLATSAACERAAAQTPSGGLLDRPARLEVRDVPLARALQQLSDRSRVALVYSPSLLPTDHRVSCSCIAATTRQALDTLLAMTG